LTSSLTPTAASSPIHEQDAIIINDSIFDHRLDLITARARPYLKEHLLHKISRENCSVIINYILAMQTETNLSNSYRLDTIHKLKQLAEFHGLEEKKSKSFREMTRQDIIDFLDRLRKPEDVDPLHKWIGSYNLTSTILLRFFRWLYYPDVAPSKKRPIPPVMENILQIKRKETSIYKPTELWTEADDVLFYKYCPSVRDRCWHAMSRDTGCRASELLKLKIKDVVVLQYDGGHTVAKITVNGKTGVRNVRLFKAYPFFREWVSNGHHPFPSNPNAPLFCGTGKNNTGRRLSLRGVQCIYERYQKRYFPKLLEEDSPTVPPEDKRKIADLLKNDGTYITEDTPQRLRYLRRSKTQCWRNSTWAGRQRAIPC
jgi:integrase